MSRHQNHPSGHVLISNIGERLMSEIVVANLRGYYVIDSRGKSWGTLNVRNRRGKSVLPAHGAGTPRNLPLSPPRAPAPPESRDHKSRGNLKIQICTCPIPWQGGWQSPGDRRWQIGCYASWEGRRATKGPQPCKNTGFRETRGPELGNKRLLPN